MVCYGIFCSGEFAKQQLCRCITCCHCLTTMWKCLISRGGRRTVSILGHVCQQFINSEQTERGCEQHRSDLSSILFQCIVTIAPRIWFCFFYVPLRHHLQPNITFFVLPTIASLVVGGGGRVSGKRQKKKKTKQSNKQNRKTEQHI